MNDLPADDASAELRQCCGSSWWCEQMAKQRPFSDAGTLHTAADCVFDRMPKEAWLEAFASHPRIGDLDSLKMRLAGNRQWSSAEQAGVAKADEQLLERLQQRNNDYHQKFGYTFIVCATGKSAAEMLANLKQRLEHNANTELDVAAEQQRRITHLRIDKLFASKPPDA